MSEIPQVSPGSKRTLDLARPFAFVFEDPEWVPKVLVGGLFYLAAFILVGIPFLFGYAAQLSRNVIEGSARPLPSWQNLGEYLAEGLKLLGIVLIYIVPLCILWVLPFIFLGILSSTTGGGEGLEPFAALFTCFAIPVFLLASLWLPGALLFAVATGRFDQAFNFSGIASFIKNNFVNYLIAIIIHLVANFLSQFGIILLCIGVIFTGFWSMLVSTFAFAETYRLSKNA